MRIVRLTLALLAFLSLSALVCAQSTESFSFRKPIVFQPSQIAGPTPHVDFPALVEIVNDNDLRTVGNGGKVQSTSGFDIVFTAADGTTKLDYEVESYDGVNGSIRAWVRMASLPTLVSTTIYINYGSAAVVFSQETAAAVWTSDYVGVWHLSESGSGFPGEYRDSSIYEHHGQGGKGGPLYVPTRTAGQIGFGQDFNNADGKYDMIDVGNSSRLDVDTNQITLHAWIRHAITPTFGVFRGFLNHKGFSNGYRLFLNDNPHNLSFQLPGATHNLTTAGIVTANVWHHIVATYDGTTMRAYIDGVQDVNTVAKAGNISTVPPNEDDVWIGHGDQPLERPWSYEWEGQIDEVRISTVARDGNWVLTEFNNQSSPSTFAIPGPEQAGPFNVSVLEINYRSIGNGGVPYTIGDASVAAGSKTVTFGAGASLPATAGVGDLLTLDTGGVNEPVYVLTRDSATQVTLQKPAVFAHAGVTYSLQRAFASPVAWETARDANLVGDNRREVGVIYGDGGGPFTAGVNFVGATTDAERYMHLTVDPASRHTGIAGTGVIFDGVNTAGNGVRIQDDYTRVDWLELIRHRGAGGAASVLVDANHVKLSNLLIHDYDDVGFVLSGIRITGAGGRSYTLRNSILYDGDDFGLLGNGALDIATIENTTIYGTAGTGISENSSRFDIYNTISAGHPVGNDFNVPNAQAKNNLSTDGTAPGLNSVTNVLASDQFQSLVVSSEDFHLKGGADARDAAIDLLPRFGNDIDGETRNGLAWDIGADESPASWWNSSWKARQVIGFNNAAQTENLMSFPVLICLTPAKIDYASTKAGGADLRFVDADDVTPLNYEIESWVPGGNSFVWVNVPQIDGGSNTDFIYMYYDNPGASDAQMPALVWDADFKMVQHLQETAGAHADSTSFNNDSVVVDVQTQGSATGKINGADDFVAASMHNIDVADNANLDVSATESLTAEVWVKTSTTGTFQFAVNKKDGSADWQIHISAGDSPDFWLNDGTDTARANGVTNITDGNWHYLVGRWDRASSTAEIFLDGVSDASQTNALVGDLSNARPLVIGEEADVSRGFNFDGCLDEVRVSKVPRSNDWIQAQYLSQSCGFATFGPPTTAVTLISFDAKAHDGAVELEWETSSEMNNLGFHLYRADAVDGDYERITRRPIPGLGSSPVGGVYRYVDSGLVNEHQYFYQLEDIETTGKSERHPPVSATPRRDAGAIDDESARVVYGSPEDNRFRIIDRDQRGVVLELVTRGFEAVPTEDGSVEIRIPGFDEILETGGASLPAKRSWIDAVAGQNVKLGAVRASELESFVGLSPIEGATPELVANARGTVRAQRTRGRRRYRGGDLFPAEWARIADVAYQGTTRKALVELTPLRWDGRRGALVLAERLRVKIVFRGKEVRRAGGAQPALGVAARIVTREAGLYAVAVRDDRSDIRLTRHGVAVPYHLERDEPNARNRLDRPNRGTATLYFMSPGGQSNPYGDEAVFDLAYGAGGQVMEVSQAAPAGASLTHYGYSEQREANRIYQAGLVHADDVWLWDALLAPARNSYGFTVSELANVASPAHLELWLQGGSDFATVEDHHVLVYVNGALAGEARWNGKYPRLLEADIRPGVLRDGDNVVEVENAGDTDAAYSLVFLDRFEVRYPRSLTPIDGVVSGVWDSSGIAAIDGARFVVDITGAQPRWVRGASIDAAGTLRVRVETGRRYHAAAEPLIPEIRHVGHAKLTRWTQRKNRADYVVVGPREFLRAARPLLRHRARQGLRVKAVPIEDVFEVFGYGEKNPEAIRDFLDFAYHQWRRPALRYVLLLGDGTYDYKDYLQTGVENRVPPLLLETSFLWTASDPALAALNGDDLLPDVAIGRLPAASVDEVNAMVDKILAYENGEASLASASVLIADDADEAGDFESRVEDLASTVLQGRPTKKIFLSELGASGARSEISASFNEGASLVSYVGHGGIQVWADENIFNGGDVAGLSYQSQQPLLLTMNCLNGYFHFPYFDSLAEKLVKAPERGAIAALSPSGLSLDGPAHTYHTLVLDEVLHGGHARLGDAILEAQVRFAKTGALPELLAIYHLLGDPALALH